MNAEAKQAMFNLRDELNMFPETLMITVKRSDLATAVNHLFHSGEEWSNQAAFGYAIAAALSIRMSTEDIQKLVNAMRREFDEQTLDSAAEVYQGSSY